MPRASGAQVRARGSGRQRVADGVAPFGIGVLSAQGARARALLVQDHEAAEGGLVAVQNLSGDNPLEAGGR